MSEHDPDHGDFACRGPLGEWERDEFDFIAGGFLHSAAQAPSTGFRKPGAPSYVEFVTTTGYDENGVGDQFEAVRLASLPVGALLSKEIAHSIAPLDRQVVGVDTEDHLRNAQIILDEIGHNANAPTQPQHERLDFSD